MKSSSKFAMKLIASSSTLLAVGSFALALTSLPYAGALYLLAFSASLVAIVATDYAPRARRWEPSSLKLGATASSATKRQSLQLAA